MITQQELDFIYEFEGSIRLTYLPERFAFELKLSTKSTSVTRMFDPQAVDLPGYLNEYIQRSMIDYKKRCDDLKGQKLPLTPFPFG